MVALVDDYYVFESSVVLGISLTYACTYNGSKGFEGSVVLVISLKMNSRKKREIMF